jgi:Tripartite tricarboxylate transporter family receptor
LIFAHHPRLDIDGPLLDITQVANDPPCNVIVALAVIGERQSLCGAIGTIGLAAVAKATPNGYTLGILNVPYIVAPNLLAQMPFDFERDLAPVSLMAWNYSVRTK